MFYLSQVLGASVEDRQGKHVGKLVDILIVETQVGSNEATYPDMLLVEGEAGQLKGFAPRDVERRDATIVSLAEQGQPLEQGSVGSEIHLGRDVLDKQVINIERKKAIRVNDVCFDDDWRLLGIDNSTFGLIRRLAPPWLLGPRSHSIPSDLVPWSEIEIIGNVQQEEEAAAEQAPQPPAADVQPVKRIPSGHLSELHPADIAEIVHQLTSAQGARLIERLDDETAADTMEEIDTERQLHILENIQPERAAAVLRAMEPDEVADLLSHLPEERRQELLRFMAPEDSEDVQDLLEYAPDTAGGLMTTDYISMDPQHSIEEALAVIRTNIQEQHIHVAYIYCVADETQEEQQIVGVVSLWELLVAEPDQRLADLMKVDIITVQADSDPQAVAEIMAKYNFLAVPVVDSEGMLQGVVTVDDALDVLLPPERRRRPASMY